MGTAFDYRTGLLNDHPFEDSSRNGSAACHFKGPLGERDSRTIRSEDLPRPTERHADPFGSSTYSDEESSNADSDASSVRSYSTNNTSYSGEFIVAEPADSVQASDHHPWNAKHLDEGDGQAPKLVRNYSRLNHSSTTDVSLLLEGLKSEAGIKCEAEILGSVSLLTKVCGGTLPTPSEQGTQAQPDTKPSLSTRRRSAGNSSVPPPRLKRDTDSADLFVNLLIAFACRLITAVWPLAATPPMMSDCFNGAGVLPLHTFIYETLRRSKTSYSTLQIALYYLILLKPNLQRLCLNKEQSGSSATSSSKDGQSCRAMQCGRRMFLSALILASKYIQDRNYSTRAWSKISGLRIPEINENERQYLRLINYSLHIKQSTFENWSKVVLLLSRISKMQPGSFDLGQRPCQQPGPDLLPTLVGQAGNATSAGLYTKDWWNQLCSNLDPNTFQDSARTDAFIMEHIPVEQIERAMHMTLTPPNASQTCSDLTFSEPHNSRVGSSLASTPVQLAASSPAHSLDVPTRPRPRKLQTPNSTPRGPEFTSGVSQFGTRTPRHTASVDALRSLCMRKQACNASIDRCPPPQTPQLQTSSSEVRTWTLPGPSPPTTPCRQQSAALWPHVTMSVYRSRSNSISSNSSNSTNMSPLRDVSTWSSSCKPSLMTPKSVDGDSLSCSDSVTRGQYRPLRRKRASGNLGPAAKQGMDRDEGYYSAEDPRHRSMMSEQGQSELENSVAGALVAMSVGSQDSITPRPLPLRSQESTPKASAQLPWSGRLKRTPSEASDALADHTRPLLCADTRIKEEMARSSPSTTDAMNMFPAAKQVQQPHRAWAQLKQPVWNSHPCKRIAMDGTAQRTRMTAPELASTLLRPDIEAQ